MLSSFESMPKVAARFNNKSVAEQNFVDIAWALLMESDFDNLRSCIASSEEELKRFRKLIIAAVISTDIADADIRRQRAEKWDKAFSKEDGNTAITNGTDTDKDDVNIADRRATAVLEQVIQASTVSHTMQHWHVYIKWNKKLFEEQYVAFIAGRADRDPSEAWYEG